MGKRLNHSKHEIGELRRDERRIPLASRRANINVGNGNAGVPAGFGLKQRGVVAQTYIFGRGVTTLTNFNLVGQVSEAALLAVVVAVEIAVG
jgi:hypothetical protein